MCGIAESVKRAPRETVDEARLKRMRDLLRHRGPDGEGLLLDGPVGLGHRGLSIIDVAGGHQPMANEDETIWIVYNGEIYNHAALRPGLEQRGHRYRNRSDTETILHVYEEDGDRCVERLRGMFAFALWDRSRGRLLLARDALGIKPLYYTCTDDEILFASGGIDSSALAILMARMVEEPVRTFSVGFDDPRANELSWARLIADTIGAEHREVIVSPGEFFAALPRLIWHEDEPIATPASVPLAFVSRLAREHGKVVLTGEGADELFLGYNRYRVTAWNHGLGRVWETAVPGGIRRTSARIARALPSRLRRYTDATFLARPATPRALFFDGFAAFTEATQRDLLADASLLRDRKSVV